MPAGQPPQQAGRSYKPWSVFSHRDFNILLASGVAMVVSHSLTTLVSAQWLYEETGSAAQLGLLGAVHLVQMPIALYGGTLADSVDRKKLMTLTQGVSFAVLLALTVLAALDRLVPWHIFAATGVSGVAGLLGGSARPAMLPRVVPRRLLINGVTSQNVTSQIAAVGRRSYSGRCSRPSALRSRSRRRRLSHSGPPRPPACSGRPGRRTAGRRWPRSGR